MPRIGKISGRTLYTAEEYLAMPKYALNTKFKKEFENLEKEYNKSFSCKKKDVKNEIQAKQIVDEICKKKNISSYIKNGRYNIKNKKRAFALVADRKNYVSVSTWNKGGKDFKTIKIRTNEEMKNILTVLEGMK
jgi:hypothetical protein